MLKRASILILILGLAVSSFTCLCSHEKPAQTATSQSCHGHSEEAQTQNPVPTSKDCCCMDKHNVGETQEVLAFSPVNFVGTELIIPATFESFQPVIVAFKLDRNFHPPSNKLPIYFSKHSFLI